MQPRLCSLASPPPYSFTPSLSHSLTQAEELSIESRPPMSEAANSADSVLSENLKSQCLVHLLHQGIIQSTFENVCRHQTAETLVAQMSRTPALATRYLTPLLSRIVARLLHLCSLCLCAHARVSTRRRFVCCAWVCARVCVCARACMCGHVCATARKILYVRLTCIRTIMSFDSAHTITH